MQMEPATMLPRVTAGQGWGRGGTWVGGTGVEAGTGGRLGQGRGVQHAAGTCMLSRRACMRTRDQIVKDKFLPRHARHAGDHAQRHKDHVGDAAAGGRGAQDGKVREGAPGDGVCRVRCTKLLLHPGRQGRNSPVPAAMLQGSGPLPRWAWRRGGRALTAPGRWQRRQRCPTGTQ